MDYFQAVQVGTLLRNCGWAVASYIASVLTIGIIYKDSVPPTFLLTWLFVGLAIHIIEFCIVFASLRTDQPLKSDFWKWSIYIGCVFSGLFFASSLLFLMYAETTAQITIHVIVYSLVVASIITGSAYYLTAYYLIFPPLVVPVIGVILYFAESSQYFFLITLALLLVGMHFFIVGFNAVFQKLIRSEEKTTSLLLEVRVERDRAKNAMMEKNQFLALASHDLRQPVHAMGLFVAALEKHVTSVEGKGILEYVKQSSNTMGALFNSILDLSKLDADAVDNNPQNMSLSIFLHKALPEFSSLAAQKGIKIDIDCPSYLQARVDPVILHRVVSNLVINAIKFSEDGVVKIIGSSDSDQRIELTVVDEGVGISESEIDTIFSEYHQLQNPERNRQSGLGLGLSIVKRLCALANIQLSVKSELGRGSSFALQLERVADTAAAHSDGSTEDVRSQQYRVAIVDDEIEILEAMSVLLEQQGCTVFSGTTGTEVLSHFCTGIKPNIIVADYRLKGTETGIDLIDEFRSKFDPQLPAILVTGDTAAPLLQEFLASNVRVLHKPVLPKDLLKAIDEVTTEGSLQLTI